jgi:plastocyanin
MISALRTCSRRWGRVLSCCGFTIGLLIPPLGASTVTGNVTVVSARKRTADSGVAIWLQPRNGEAPPLRPHVVQMVQHHKQFQPHVLAIPVGTVVDFPNLDPIFHNAFSNIDGKPFDVGLYPPGSSKRVAFDRPGIVHVFCNIHQAMSAVIVVQDTPWIAVSGRGGEFTIADVPPGEYTLHVYYERATRETLDSLVRNIQVGPSATALPPIRISETGYIEAPHKNKYGREYPAAEQGSYTGAQ